MKAYSYIRFSTPDQLKGDSLRRQLKESENYAKENGLTLDTTINLKDLGLSAFHGAHKTKGALGGFLKQIEEGKIEKGSVLIVENLDRLSREQISEALMQFMNIINAGIRIVTLQDKQEYTKETINDNWSQLIISITYMARAHEESNTKSKRLKSAWEEKRIKALNGERKLTGRCPSWLELSKDKKSFKIITEVSKVIELIYRLKLSGKSKTAMIKELNSNDKIWKPKNGWRDSYIQKLISTRAVIGEFQPHKLVDGKRVDVGEPIADYFPKIIENELFYQVQELIKLNREQNGHGGGKTGKANNLFTHLVKCGLCKGAMHYIDKGKLPKGGQYLHCDNSRRKNGCNAKPIRYKEFEKLFFDDFEGLDINELLPDKDETQIEINNIESSMLVKTEQIKELDIQIKNLTNSISTTSDARVRETLEKSLSEKLKGQDKLKEESKGNKDELKALKIEYEKLRENINKTQEVYHLLEEQETEEEKMRMRLVLRQAIKRLVKSIHIYPLQEKFKKIEEIEPGIIKTMDSKYIDKVRIVFKKGVSRTKKIVLFLKSYGEIIRH